MSRVSAFVRRVDETGDHFRKMSKKAIFSRQVTKSLKFIIDKLPNSFNKLSSTIV